MFLDRLLDYWESSGATLKIPTYKKLYDTLAQKAKLFLIDKTQAEIFSETSLPSRDYLRSSFRLPFDQTFIEFSEPLGFKVISEVSGEESLRKYKGVYVDRDLVAKKEKTSIFSLEKTMLDSKPTEFYGFRFFDTQYQDDLVFSLPCELPDFYMLCYDKCKASSLGKKLEIYDPISIISKHKTFCEMSSGTGCDYGHSRKDLFGLTLKLITFINSKNVLFEKARQGSHKLDRKRKKKGKLPLKDYHFVKVDKRQPVYIDGEPRKGYKHSVRYDVRGHFAFYHHCPSCDKIYPKIVPSGKDCGKCGYEIDKFKVEPRWMPEHMRGLASRIYRPKILELKEQAKT